MKFIILTIILLTVAGCGKTEFKGELEVVHNSGVLPIYADGETAPTLFENGEVDITFSKNSNLKIEQPATNSKVNITASNGLMETTNFEILSSETDQSFDLIGEIESIDILEQQIKNQISCKQSGYCVTCLLGYNGNNKCGFKHSPNCPGKRMALQNKRTYLEAYVIHFIDDYSKERIAKFSTKPVQKTESTVIEYLSDCE